MSWLYSQVLVEEYSEAKCLDGEQCALWNGTHMQQASWLPAKTTKHSRLFRSGMTFKPLTDDLGEAVFQSCLEAFPVRTYPVQEKGPELTESDQVCGDTWQESSVKFDPNTCSWKTHQCLWDEDLPESSVTLPKWGMMQNGVLWERTTLPPLTSGTESGSWPTPRCFMHKDALKDRGKSNLGEVVNEMEGMKITGQLNPDWVEWLMGWPIGWTDLNALETDKFLMWPHTHGDSLEGQ
jgi:hypothetical protein